MNEEYLPTIIEKIINVKPDTYIIFFVNTCPYCQRAISLLNDHKVRYKGYDIDTIDGGMPKLLEVLNKYKNLLNFNPDHKTKPIIFFNKKFIGGYTDLEKKLSV